MADLDWTRHRYCLRMKSRPSGVVSVPNTTTAIGSFCIHRCSALSYPSSCLVPRVLGKWRLCRRALRDSLTLTGSDICEGPSPSIVVFARKFRVNLRANTIIEGAEQVRTNSTRKLRGQAVRAVLTQRAMLAAFVFLLVAAPLLDVASPVGNATARLPSTPSNLPSVQVGQLTTASTLPSQAPNFAGAYVVDGGRIFAYLGYAGFANLWYGAGINGSEIYADGLWILAYNLVDYPVSLTVDVKETGYGWQNSSTPLGSYASVSIPVGLQSNPAWTDIKVVMGGVQWEGFVATPVSLLPLQDFNLGGLDLMIMVALSECVIGFSFLTWVAWRVMKNAIWAPKFSLIVWGHVFLFTTFVTVIADYQQIDQLFGGWSPFVYIVPLLPMWFAFALSLFNRTTKRECIQITSLPNQRLMIGRYLLRLGKNQLGDIVLIQESWSAFWARAWKHYVTLTPKDMTKPEPLVIPVSNLASPTETGKGKHKKSGRRLPKSMLWDVAPVVNEQEDEVDGMSFVKAGATVEARFPKLVWSAMKHIPETTVFKKDGSNRIVPAHDRKVWTLPHYIEGNAEQLPLHDIHAMPAVAVSAMMLHAFDLSQVIGETKTALFILKSQFGTKVEAEVEARLAAYFALMGFTPTELNEETADRASVKRKDDPSRIAAAKPQGE